MGETIFDAQEDIENWEPVESGSNNTSEEDFDNFDLEFIDMDDVEEGDFWLGTYDRVYQFDGASSPSILFKNEDEELTYAFPNHTMIRTQLADTELTENQNRANKPVESEETVAIVYQGTRELEGRPMDMHVWELRRPPE